MIEVKDAIVVGAGVIGCAIASELAQAGLDVLVLEKDRIGAGASGVAAGMLAPQSEAHAADDWLQLLLTARDGYPSMAHKLHEETGVDVGYRPDGVLRVALTDAEACELRARGEWQRGIGLAAEWLSLSDVQQLEPGISEEIAGALWLPREAQVRSPLVVQGLARLAMNSGATFEEGTLVLGIEHRAGHVSGVRTMHRMIHSEVIVLATGVWTAFVADALPGLPLEPVKGQIVSGLAVASSEPRHMLWGPNAYVAPKGGGQILIGATEEPTYDLRPTIGATARLVTGACQLLPDLSTVPFDATYAGLRPALPDRRPVLGRVDDVDGLYIATGHYRNGMLLGPLTGKLMSQLILDGRTDVNIAPYSPSRFAAVAAAPISS